MRGLKALFLALLIGTGLGIVPQAKAYQTQSASADAMMFGMKEGMRVMGQYGFKGLSLQMRSISSIGEFEKSCAYAKQGAALISAGKSDIEQTRARLKNQYGSSEMFDVFAQVGSAFDDLSAETVTTMCNPVSHVGIDQEARDFKPIFWDFGDGFDYMGDGMIALSKDDKPAMCQSMAQSRASFNAANVKTVTLRERYVREGKDTTDIDEMIGKFKDVSEQMSSLADDCPTT